MTRAKRGNNNSAYTAASLPLIIAGRGIRSRRKPLGTQKRHHDLSFLNVEFQASVFTLLFHAHQEALYFLFCVVKCRLFLRPKLLFWMLCSQMLV